MSDAKIGLDEEGGDLVLSGDDLARDEGLETAVLLSVLSDARASTGATSTGVDPDTRGWWADTIRDRFGSRLWTLEREKRTRETLARAVELGRAALQWLIEDGVASSVEVSARFDEFGRLILDVEIHRGESRRYASVWKNTQVATIQIGLTQGQPAPIPEPEPEPEPEPIPDQNVVIFTLDDGGSEWFEWSGFLEPFAGYALTPRLNELRARGVTFLRAQATSVCGPTRANIQTGRHSFRHGLGGNLDGAGSHGYGLGDYAGVQTELLLSRALRLGRDGTADQTIGANAFTYASGWFGKGHIFSDSGMSLYPVGHGWGRYVGCPPNAASLENWPIGAVDPLNPGDPGYVTPHANSGHFHFRDTTSSFGATVTVETFGAAGTWPAGGPYVAWDTTTTPRAAWDGFDTWRNALQWVNTRSQPFLAKVCINPPHAPFETPPYTYPDTVGVGATGLTKNLISPATQTLMTSLNGGAGGPGFVPTDPNRRRQVFRANIEAFDTLVGAFWDRMDPAKRDRTVFIVTGDNGTVSDCVDAPYDGTHSKRTIFEMGYRVPFVVFGSEDVIAEPGRTCDHLVHSVDIFSTVLDITGCEPELWNPGGARKIDGRSFAPVLRNPRAPAARSFQYNELFLPLGAQHPGNPSGTPPIPSIPPNQWAKSYSDGTHKIHASPSGTTPPYKLFNVTDEIQPGSGEPGYLERDEDNLYPLVVDGLHPDLTAIFETLLAALDAHLAS